MARFELTGSGISDGQDAQWLLSLAKRVGCSNPRIAYHMGLSNQPRTVRFTATDWNSADALARAIRGEVYPQAKQGQLAPMIRAYPVKKGE